jgi:hypothetical protein
MSRGQRKKGARLKLNLDKIQRFQKLHRTWVSIGTSASWALGSFYEAFAARGASGSVTSPTAGSTWAPRSL